MQHNKRNELKMNNCVNTTYRSRYAKIPLRSAKKPTILSLRASVNCTRAIIYYIYILLPVYSGDGLQWVSMAHCVGTGVWRSFVEPCGGQLKNMRFRNTSDTLTLNINITPDINRLALRLAWSLGLVELTTFVRFHTGVQKKRSNPQPFRPTLIRHL